MTYNFRPNQPLYRGEYYLTVTIPATEHRDVIPCAATPNADGSHRLQFAVLYAHGDLCFLRERGEQILRDHPTWVVGVYLQAGLVGYIEAPQARPASPEAISAFADSLQVNAAPEQTYFPGTPEFERQCREDAARIEGERLTLQFKAASSKRLDKGRKPITDAPLFGGAAQEELF